MNSKQGENDNGINNDKGKYNTGTTDGKNMADKNSANRDFEEAVVTIRDAERGISSDIYPQLFTKFTTNSDVGTGLGLFISKSIIEAHGGAI